MIITQTPLRVSFLGGGTDFSEYYLREGGWVVTSAIDKYIYVIIKERFDNKIRVGYTRTEMVDHIDQVEHELVRECLRKTGIERRVEIATMGDIPSQGSGLGSSSTVTVGLLNAMYTYLGTPVDAARLAREACEIEIDVLGKPIGVQDQYIAAYGGQRFLHFGTDGCIGVESLGLDDHGRRMLSERLLLFFTGVTRRSETVLREQVEQLDDRLDVLARMKGLAVEARELLRAGELDGLGRLLDMGWQQKKRLASRISNPEIDEMYRAACEAGALGGKLCGAGGGGFLLLYCPPEHQDRVRRALRPLAELPFNLERDGSKVIFNCRR